MTGLNFNATTVAPNVGFVAAPKGRYTVIATKAAIEPTRDGSGKIIQWNFVAQGGNSHGRSINLNTTWENQNPKAIELGHGQLSAICHAVGVLIPQDLRQLLNIPFILEIDITPDGKYNQIVAIEPIPGAQQQQQAGPPQTVVNPYGGQPQPQQQPQYQQPAPQQQPYQQPQPGPVQQPYYDPAAQQQGGAPPQQQQPQHYGPPAGAPPQGQQQAPQGGYQPPQGGAPQGYQPPQQQQGYQAPPQVMPDPNAPAPQAPQWVANQVANEQPPVSGGYQPPQQQPQGYGPGPF